MKFLCATQFFEPDVGGMQVSNTLLVDGLIAEGHEVELHLFGLDGVDGRQRGVVRFHHPFDPRGILSLRRCAATILRRQRASRPDAVLLLDESMVRALGVRLFRPHTGPIVSVNSGSTLTRIATHTRGRVNAALVRRGYRWLHRLFVSSSTMHNFRTVAPSLLDRTKELGRPIPDEFYTEPLASGWLREQYGDDLPFLFSCARAEHAKGVGLVIEALARLKAQHGREPVRFVFVGAGPALPEWRNRARALGLSHVHFLGVLPLDRIRACLDDAWMVVLTPTTEFETFGRTWVEAFARGVPVISTAMDNLKYLMRHGENGFLTSPDPVAIADTIEKALRLSAEEYQVLVAGARASAAPFQQRQIVRQLLAGIRGLA